MPPKKNVSLITVGVLCVGLSLLISLPAIFAGDIYRELRSGYISLFQNLSQVNWVQYRVNLLTNWIGIQFADKSTKGLPGVRLYISESDKIVLTSNIPTSIKQWKPGKALYPNNELEKVKVRHRGDNPVNWAFAKKSWRIKTRKKKLIDGSRSFNLVATQDPVVIDAVFYSQLAKKIGLEVANSRLIELFINDQYQGVYTELEHLDESYLRNNRHMPVNLYKGEQRMSSQRYGADFDLYHNPSLWTKLSVNNYINSLNIPDVANSDVDLRYVLNLVRRAANSDAAFKKLLLVAPFDIWAKYSAAEILMQQNSDARHNTRLIVDIWDGTVKPIVQDPQAIYRTSSEEVFFDKRGSRPEILRIYGQDSRFRLERQKYLWQMVKDRMLTEHVKEFKKLKPIIEASLSRDPNIHVTMRNDSFLDFDYSTRFNTFMVSNQLIEDKLSQQLTSSPQAVWQSISPSTIAIDIAGQVPLSNISVQYSENSQIPSAFFFDKNKNGQIDPTDMPLPFSRKGSGVSIDATFMSNMIYVIDPEIRRLSHYGFKPRITPARFHILSNMPQKISDVQGTSAITGKTFKIKMGSLNGVTPTKRNLPLITKKKLPSRIWSGTVEILSDRVIEAPSIIKAGTVFKMASNASLIFRGKVTAQGTRDNPIRVEPLSAKPWGTFALVGKKSAGSRLKHIKLRDGGGDAVGLLRFTAMLSIHNTSNITLDDISVSNNLIEDDMLHIVYSQNVTINGGRFENALSDAVDIDVSSVKISDSIFINSGNDAIDLMASKASISNVYIKNAGDKGISVGEKSRVLVVDTTIENAKFAIQSKDGSSARIAHSSFVNNTNDLNAYWKNWRYETGGQIFVDKSILSAPRGKSKIKAQKRSRIYVHDSSFSFAATKSKRVVFKNIDSQSDSKLAIGKSYSFELDKLISNTGLPLTPDVRGPRN